ncbi:hypothetical protein P154DRAFT_623687 [Amniculicola lignicola CBS 123094]|uniref:Uncharacterized protein n=1 Tax=Amniculicola lignicola CBS 123094 TaxID=1392246 RepID=A0A6A5WDN5_9PLEO|nr:hypothetical protein P154DRAFT_623687 [Amniculicola lignicola CBS 123094]
MSMTLPPPIRIEDWCGKHPKLKEYHQGENVIDFQSTFTRINDLKKHPGRGHVVSVTTNNTMTYQLQECSDVFTREFLSSSSTLCDYLADFRAYDDPLTQSIWFQLIDAWKNVAQSLPHQGPLPTCTHWNSFIYQYKQILELMNTLMSATSPQASHMIHHNQSFAIHVPQNPGGFKAGLKPWQQFLYNESPGFTVPEHFREYPGQPAKAKTEGQPAKDKTEDKKKEENSGDAVTVHIPRGGIAILQKHHDMFAKAADRVAARMRADPNVGPEKADEFRRNYDKSNPAIDLSQPVSTRQTMDGRTMTMRPMYPRPDAPDAPHTQTDGMDPAAFAKNPDFMMMDEQIGQVMVGGQPVQHPNGTNRFQMLSVSTSRAVTGTPVLPGLSETFDDWLDPNLDLKYDY